MINLRIHPGRETTSYSKPRNSPDDGREDGCSSFVASSCPHISDTGDKGHENITEIPVPRNTESLNVMRKIIRKVAANANGEHPYPRSKSNGQKERYGKDEISPDGTRTNTCGDTIDIKRIKRGVDRGIKIHHLPIKNIFKNPVNERSNDGGKNFSFPDTPGMPLRFLLPHLLRRCITPTSCIAICVVIIWATCIPGIITGGIAVWWVISARYGRRRRWCVL